MNRRHRKGAIELSANFIVVIIISFVILVGGISIFFKLKASAQNYVDTVDKQTQDNIKSIMLSNNYRVAVYPRDLTLKSGDGEQVGIGITNIDDVAKDFTIKLYAVKYYQSADTPVMDTIDGGREEAYYIQSSTTPFTIAPKNQVVKGVLLKMPDTRRGQYVYTFDIITTADDGTGDYNYGVVQVYVTN